MNKTIIVAGVLALITGSAVAQMSQGTRIQGKTEINVDTKNTVAVATGQNTVAKNRIGVIKGDKKGNTTINVAATNVTTIASGRNKRACTNIGGIVSDDCK